MKILSLFDGISGAYVALMRAGIQIDKYYSSEIDKYAIAVSKHNFMDIVRLGDVLWYIAVMADLLGYSLETVALMNAKKLATRKKENKIQGDGDNR